VQQGSLQLQTRKKLFNVASHAEEILLNSGHDEPDPSLALTNVVSSPHGPFFSSFYF
jgi:hypothetical protein